MNPQGGEGNNQPPAGMPEASVPNVEAPVNVSSPDPLSDLQSVIENAGKQATDQKKAPVQTPTVPPQAQFERQFGSAEAATPPVAEVTVPVAPLDPGIETVAPAEKTPADKLKEEVSDSVAKFLEKVTKEKAAA